jgi:hypothetical protein
MVTTVSVNFLALAFFPTMALGAIGGANHNHKSPTITATAISNLRADQRLRSPALSSVVSKRKLDSCPNGDMFVQVDFVTDQHPKETSWELYDSSGNTIKSWKYGDYGWDDMQPNDAWLDTVGCIPEDECYTFAVFDNAGNGMVSVDHDAYYDGSYFVYVNPDQTFSEGIVVESGDVAFGSSILHTFGKCTDETKEESCPQGTVPVTLDFTTADDGDDVTMYLVDLGNEAFLWNVRGLRSATAYHYFACLDATTCANLVLSNHRQSNVTVTYNGEEIYMADEQEDGCLSTVVPCNC